MQLLSKILLTIALLAGFSHCGSDPPEVKTSSGEVVVDFIVNPIAQKVLFQVEYRTTIWGYAQRGWILDSAGQIHCYNLPHSWTFVDEEGYITSDDMELNLLSTDSICHVINNRDLLQKKHFLIEKAAQGTVSEPVRELWDGGDLIYSAFTYDTTAQSYKEVILKQTIDFRVDNNTAEAQHLYLWLDSLRVVVNHIF